MVDQQNRVVQHSIGRSLLLHLLPGILVGACYYALLPLVRQFGLPSMMSLMLACGLVLIPAELGYLLYAAKKEGGGLLRDVISYRTAIPVWQYLVWVPVLFIVLGAIFTAMKPVDAFLQGSLFGLLPTLETGLGEGYTRRALVATYAMVACFGVAIGPVVEELYFRGHLLPRMGYAGKWAPLLHSFLFALYHIWTPWMLLTRTLGMLPLVYAAQRRSLYLSIVVHILVNVVDLVVAAVFIVGMSHIN